jgi:hypothetical protein
LVDIVTVFDPVAVKDNDPAFVTKGVVRLLDAVAVVNAPVEGVVAPTVPLIAPPVEVRAVKEPVEGAVEPIAGGEAR